MAFIGNSSWDDSDEFESFKDKHGDCDYDEYKRIKERAREIESGWASGMWESDERVWNEVKKIKGE